MPSRRRKLFNALNAQCPNLACGRYIRQDIAPNQQHFKVLHIKCPYCETPTSGRVYKTVNVHGWHYHGTINGQEPYFGYPLYFSTHFDGKPVWVLNRAHLSYLIDYIEADLREKPMYITRVPSYYLPKYMKLAKNRHGLLKVLKRLQQK